jgi:hypothetical protein
MCMDVRTALVSFGLTARVDNALTCRELRLYRPDGALSLVYFGTFESDGKAISEAKRLARYGYQIDVWRDGTRVGRVPTLGVRYAGERP